MALLLQPTLECFLFVRLPAVFNRVPAEVWTAVDVIGVDVTAVRLAQPAYTARNAVSGGANTTLADERVNATVPMVRTAWASPIKALRALSAGQKDKKVRGAYSVSARGANICTVCAHIFVKQSTALSLPPRARQPPPH